MAEEELIEENQSEEQLDKVQPLIIETKGKFQPFEAMTGQEMEVGKTYNIKVQGLCEFAISNDRPQSGLQTNEITYTKKDDTQLWIKTGG